MTWLGRVWQMSRRQTVTLRGRAAFATVSMTLLLVLAGGLSVWSTVTLERVNAEISRTTRVAVALLPSVSADLQSLRTQMRLLVETPTPLAMRRHGAEIRTLEEEIARRLDEAAWHQLGGSGVMLEIRSEFALWPALRERIFAALKSGDTVTAFNLAKTDGAALLVRAAERMQGVQRHADHVLQRQLAIREDTVRGFLVVQITLVMVGLLIILAGALTMHRWVIQPSRDIVSAITKIADGQLSTQIPHAERADEIGEIARATRVFLDHAIAVRESDIDLLTGLPGRNQLHDHIEVTRLDPDNVGLTAALLRIDLDRFGEINDACGRAVGDKVLAHVADILRRAARLGDFVARDANDSFLMMAVGRRSAEVFDGVARPLCREIAEPFTVDGHAMALSCCVGIVEYDPSSSIDDLLRGTEHAVTEAQRTGPGSIVIYTDEMNARLQRRRETLAGLRFALCHDEITPFFQPQIETVSGAVVGMEALVRWNHPEHGVLSPWQFLDIAQDAGMMSQITDTMIAQSVTQLAAWQRMGFGVRRVSINITAMDLRRGDFVDRLALMTEQAGLEPDQICVELLESAMIEESDDPVSRTLRRLLSLGFPIELDDFGTGHAAVSTLQLIQLSGVKIDRSFITRLHESSDQRKLARAMLSLARAMEVTCIAEGVESEAERVVLAELGCDLVQGFGIARPMPGHEATDWLETYRPKPIEQPALMTA